MPGVLTQAGGGQATELSFSIEINGSGLTSFVEPTIASAAKGDIEASLTRLEARSPSPISWMSDGSSTRRVDAVASPTSWASPLTRARRSPYCRRR